jgi:hypothetical protein
MADPNDLSRGAGDRYRSAVELSVSDAQQRRFRYHLLRLTVVGLTKQDVVDLGELGRLAFQESNVTEQSTRIKERADASPLAVAIADILERAASGRPGSVSLGSVLLGAALGAYTSLHGFQDGHETAMAILGSVGGAVAASTSALILDNINQQGAYEYLRMED